MQRLIEEQLNFLVHCINKQKRSRKDYIDLEYAKHLAELQFLALRRGNPEVGFIDGIRAAIQLYCPESEKKKAESEAKAELQPQDEFGIDEDLLFRKYVEMEKLQKYKPGSSKFIQAEKKLEEFGGELTRGELDYLKSLPEPEFILKKLKAKVSVRSYKKTGQGKHRQRCKRCGLFK